MVGRDVGRMALRFLEYGMDFDQNFKHCFEPMLQGFGASDHLSEIFKTSASEFWTVSFKNWTLKKEMYKKFTFKRFFQFMANKLNQNINVVTLFKKNTFEDPLVYKINSSARNYVPTGDVKGQTQLDPIYIVHLFDETLERNGLLASFSSTFKGTYYILLP